MVWGNEQCLMDAWPRLAEPPGKGPELELRAQQLVLSGTYCPVLSTLPSSPSRAVGAAGQAELWGLGAEQHRAPWHSRGLVGLGLGMPGGVGVCRAWAAIGGGALLGRAGGGGIGGALGWGGLAGGGGAQSCLSQGLAMARAPCTPQVRALPRAPHSNVSPWLAQPDPAQPWPPP